MQRDYRQRPINLILNRYEQMGNRGKAAGEGASGVVMKAKDTKSSQDVVAIKRPNPMLSLVERRKKSGQIRREGEALRRLNHPIACRYIEDGSWPGSSGDQYLVIGWADGQPVEEKLRELERTGEIMALGEALEIMNQLAELLVHAHAQGVVHNDLDAKHLFWDTTGVQPRLMVIDWANCGLNDDARPIATPADDLHQYGELMHRLLTGTTVAYAARLGGENNWQVEMAENEIPEDVQQIVARAVGRASNPYTEMRELYDDLQKAQQAYDNPVRQKLNRIDQLLAENTLDSLDQAEGLINEVAMWNPIFVTGRPQQLERLRRERAENLARIGGKTSLMAEDCATAQDEIADVFGINIDDMPHAEERYIYLMSDLMEKLPPGSDQYAMGKWVIEALFRQPQRAEDTALDRVLLLFSPAIPDQQPLIEELSRQTGRALPLRNRLRQRFT
jgi:hypothetical protein